VGRGQLNLMLIFMLNFILEFYAESDKEDGLLSALLFYCTNPAERGVLAMRSQFFRARVSSYRVPENGA